MSGIIFAKKITQSIGLNSNMIITGIAMFSQRIQMENISLEVYTNLMHKTPPLKSAFTRGLQRLLTCPSGIKVAALRSNAPVTRIFSPRSFRVLRRAGACTKGSGIYTVHRQHKRLPGSFSPQYRRCTVRCLPGPCRFVRRAPSD